MRNNAIIIILSVVIILAGALTAYGIFRGEDNKNKTKLNNQSSARQAALNEAEDFEPPEGTMCTQVLTPATHKETGAVYTFPNGCLPDGWERNEPAGPSIRSDIDSEAEEVESDDQRQQSSEPESQSTPPASNTSRSQQSANTATRPSITPQQDKTNVERDAVIAEAKRWHPPKGTHCTMVLTPARHIKTGTVYTFPSGCIPDGWERISDNPRVLY